jgi:hypothetical protein
MSRKVSILSVVAAVMVVSVLSVATVAFAEQEDQVGPGQPKGTLCHNGHTISVGAPAQEAHLAHGTLSGHAGSPLACSPLARAPRKRRKPPPRALRAPPLRAPPQVRQIQRPSLQIRQRERRIPQAQPRALRQAPLALPGPLSVRAPLVRQQGRPSPPIG